MVSALCVVAVWLSVLPWTDLYVTSPGGGPPLVVVALAAAIAFGVPVVVGGVFKRGFGWSLTASVGTYVVFSLVLVVTPALDPTQLVDGWAGALQRLVSSTPPLLVAAGNLVPLITVVWIVASALGETVLRSRAVAVLAAVPVVVLLVAHAIASRQSVSQESLSSQAWLALVVFVVLAMVVVFRFQMVDTQRSVVIARSERRAMATVPVIAVAVLGVVAGLTVLVVDRLPGSGSQASLEVSPPVDQPFVDAPVELAGTLRDDPASRERYGDGPMFSVETFGPTTGFFSLVSLYNFDGSTWSPPDASVFAPTGVRVPGAELLVRPQVRQEFTVGPGYLADQRWLAALERPSFARIVSTRSPDGEPDVLVDQESGTLRTSSPLASDDRYEVISSAQTGLLANLDNDTDTTSTLSPPSSALFSERVHLEVARQWVESIRPQLVDPGAPVIGRLKEIETFLRAKKRPSDEVSRTRAVSLAQLNRSFAEMGVSTPEQRSSQFVLMARTLGVPARVVVGFRIVTTPPAAQDQQPVLPEGTYELNYDDLWTWAEVFIGGLGWVTVDPAGAESGTGQSNPGTTPGAGGVGSATLGSGAIDVGVAESDTADDPEGDFPWLVMLAVVVLAGAVAVFVLGRRRRRRARRRRSGPVESVAGAWHETLDVLSEARVAGLDSLGSSEVVVIAHTQFGDEVAGPVAGVAVLADEAVFTARAMTSEQATQAWAALEATRRALRRRMTFRQRIVAGGLALRRKRW